MTSNHGRGSSSSPSPQRRPACCFGCFMGKSSRKKEKSTNLESKWESNEDILTDASTFSLKEQQRKLKKAVEEEEKARREAEKVVQWVRQASQLICAHRKVRSGGRGSAGKKSYAMCPGKRNYA